MPDIDDPFKPPDATVLRPRPGAGRRGSVDATVVGPPRVSAGAGVYSEPLPPVTEILGAGLNPLVRAASPLLLLAGHLRGTLAMPDVPALRRHVLAEIRQFEERAKSAGVANEIVLAARYALCAALDEAVLSTPWGGQTDWAQQPLLLALHKETWGGEKFFEMLRRITPDPARHLDLMELQYLCIALGFKGKFQVQERGDTRLAEVQQELYRTIRTHRGAPQPDLSLKWQGVQDRRNRLIRYIPWWVVGAAAVAILSITFAIYYTRLANHAAPVHAALATIGTADFAPRPAAPPVGPSLKQLLASDEQSGALAVEEQGARTLITLRSTMFASGSATPAATSTEMLGRVARAIEQVPGRVLVVGHTDQQPLQSLRYASNFELSRERAVSVARILQQGSSAPARFQWEGSGDSKPLVQPEVTAADRARNRRVEIVHLRE